MLNESVISACSSASTYRDGQLKEHERPTEAAACQHASTSARENNKERTFEGDRVLAQTCRLMEELMISREAAYAVAVGDAGRVYECVKVSLMVLVH